MKKNLVLSVFVLWNFVDLNAQTAGFLKGYIITLKGDTVRGEIKYNPKKELELFTKITFKVSETEKKAYGPDKIKEYNLDGQTFIPREIDGELKFIKKISQGKINLYLVKYEWQNASKEAVLTSDYYLEKKGDDELILITAKKFKKQVAAIVADDADLVKDIENKMYEYEQITEVVEKYNQWYKEQHKD